MNPSKTPKHAPRSKGKESDDRVPTPLHVAVLEDDCVRLQVLLRQNQYDVDQVGDHNFTALHLAANLGKLESCKILLRGGADPTLKTDLGDTALQLLCSRSFDDEAMYHSVVEMMLKSSCRTISHPIHDRISAGKRRSKTVLSLTSPRVKEEAISFQRSCKSQVSEFEAQATSSDLSGGSAEELVTREGTLDSSRLPTQRGRDRKRLLSHESPSPSSERLQSHRDQDNDSSSDESFFAPKRRRSRAPSRTLTDSENSNDLSSCTRSLSGHSEEGKKRRIISYPPSPLSTEFESTESSEIGHEQYIIPGRTETGSEQEQVVTSAKDVLLDAIKLRRLRSHSRVTSVIPSVFQGIKNSPILNRNAPSSPRRRPRVSSVRLSDDRRRGSISNLHSKTSVARLLKQLFNPPTLETADEYFIRDFLEVHRFFMTPQSFLKNVIIRYSINTDESVPQTVNTSIFKIRKRTLEVMIAWMKGYLPDAWMHQDVLDSIAQFVSELDKSDDPPETLPEKEIAEVKEITQQLLLEHSEPPALPSLQYSLRLLQEEITPLDDIPPDQLGEELTLYLKERFNSLSALDLALFHENEQILLVCPSIVEYYQTIDKLKRWVCTVILLQHQTSARAAAVEYFITVASRCLELRNYQGAQLIVSSLTFESIGRLNRTWAAVSSAKVGEIQQVMNTLVKSVNLTACMEQTDQQHAVIPDIEELFQEYLMHCTSTGGRKQKVNFREARDLLLFQNVLRRMPYQVARRPHITRLLNDVRPLPEEMIYHFSHSHENATNGKSKVVEMEVHGLTCRVTRGTLSVLHGKVDDLLDLLLDPHLYILVRDLTEIILLTYRYYISSGDLFYLLLQRLNLPSTEKLSLSEQELVLKRHIFVRRRVTELIQRWFAQSHGELCRDPEMKRVFLEFSRTTTLLDPDETFFYITLLNKSFQLLPPKKSHPMHRLKEEGDHFSLESSVVWTTEAIFKQNFSKIAARQICLLESELFRKITARDLLQYVPVENGKGGESANRVEQWSERFNLFSRWISTTIVTQRDPSARALVLKQFIKLGHGCVKLHNFNASYAIFAALYSNPISRLQDTWNEISPSVRGKFENLKVLFDVRGGHSKYLEALDHADPPAIPWLGIYTKHIFFIKEHNSDFMPDGSVNFEKFSSLFKVIRKVFALQSATYDFVPDPAAQQFFAQLKALSGDEIDSISRKLEGKVHNPLYQANRSPSALPRTPRTPRTPRARSGSEMKLEGVQNSPTFDFNSKIFIDDEGRKNVHVKNPLYRNLQLSNKLGEHSPSSFQPESPDKSPARTRIRKAGLRFLFGEKEKTDVL